MYQQEVQLYYSPLLPSRRQDLQLEYTFTLQRFFFIFLRQVFFAQTAFFENLYVTIYIFIILTIIFI